VRCAERLARRGPDEMAQTSAGDHFP